MSKGREKGEYICLSHLLKKPQFPLTSLSLGLDHTPTLNCHQARGMSLQGWLTRGSHIEGLLK